MRAIASQVNRLVRRWFPDQTYERGWRCADNAIKSGEDPKTLRGQACVDPHPDAFTKGWKARCDAPTGLSAWARSHLTAQCSEASTSCDVSTRITTARRI